MFTYFIPGGVESDVRAAGLAERFHEPPVIEAAELELPLQGDDGTATMQRSAGLLVRSGREASEYRRAWHFGPKLPNGELLYVGWLEGCAPHPAELLRAERPSGPAGQVRNPLSAVGEWTVPLVLPCAHFDPTRQTGLPTIPRMRGNAIVYEVDPAFDELRFRCWRWMERLIECDDDPVALRHASFNLEAAQLAADLVAVHHRVGVAELAAMDELTEPFVAQVLAMATDLALATLAVAHQRGASIERGVMMTARGGLA